MPQIAQALSIIGPMFLELSQFLVPALFVALILFAAAGAMRKLTLKTVQAYS